MTETGASTDAGDDSDRRIERADFVRTLEWLLNERGLSQRRFVADASLSSHTEVSRWKTLNYEPRPETVFRIEQVLNVLPGTLSRTLGYLPLEARPAVNVRMSFDAALDAHPFLPAQAKRIIRFVADELSMTPEAKPRLEKDG